MQRMPAHPLILIGVLAILLSWDGCTTKATIDQIIDTTSNITGTTSGAAWWSEDGQIKPDFKATAFVAFNHENLRQDLAAGRGEYLASVSRLLGVSADRESDFFSAAQTGYAKTVHQEPTALLTLLRDTSRSFAH